MDTKKVQVFISFVHKDEAYFEELMNHLAPLVKNGWCEVFSNQSVLSGEHWDSKISDALHKADMVLFLISSDFMTSEYIHQKEMRHALERYKYGETLIIPVIVRPADWQSLPVNRFAILPKDGLPVSSFTDRDTAWAERVVEPLQELIQKFRVGKLTLSKSAVLDMKTNPPPSSIEAEALKKNALDLMESGQSEKALELLLDYAKKVNGGSLNDLILLWSRHKSLKDQMRTHTISTEMYQRSSAQINVALLELLKSFPSPVVASN